MKSKESTESMERAHGGVTGRTITATMGVGCAFLPSRSSAIARPSRSSVAPRHARAGQAGPPKAVATSKKVWRSTNCNPGYLSQIPSVDERRVVSYMSLAHGTSPAPLPSLPPALPSGVPFGLLSGLLSGLSARLPSRLSRY